MRFRLALKDHRGPKAKPVSVDAKVLAAIRGQQAHRGRRVPKVRLGYPERRVLSVHRGLLAHRVSQGHKAHPASPVQPPFLVFFRSRS